MRRFRGYRDVPGYEGKYQISIATKEGKCRSLNYNNTGNKKELSNSPIKGRIYWGLCKNGKRESQQAAVWIARTFSELVQNEYFEGAEIDHINTNPLDNRPCNLRWVTRKENLNNPITRGKKSISKMGEKNPMFGKKRKRET